MDLVPSCSQSIRTRWIQSHSSAKCPHGPCLFASFHFVSWAECWQQLLGRSLGSPGCPLGPCPSTGVRGEGPRKCPKNNYFGTRARARAQRVFFKKEEKGEGPRGRAPLDLLLSDKVYEKFHGSTRQAEHCNNPNQSPDRSIGRSDGRCAQRAGT